MDAETEASLWAKWRERGFTLWDLYYTPEAAELAAQMVLSERKDDET